MLNLFKFEQEINFGQIFQSVEVSEGESFRGKMILQHQACVQTM